MNRETLATETSARNALRSEVPSFVRDAVITGLVIFGLSTAIAVFIYKTAVSTKLSEALNQLRPQAEYLASLVDAKTHAWLATPQQTGSQPHIILTNRLQNMRSYYPTVGKLFTGRYQNGQVMVILDTFDAKAGRSDLHSVATPLGIDIPAESPEIKAIMAHIPYVTDKPAFQPNGQYLGVIVPLPGGNFGTYDFLYLDTSYESVAASLDAAWKACIITILVAGIFAFVAGATVFSWRCQSFFRQTVAVAKLRENEELFRSTYELSPVAMCLTSTDGAILQANKAFCDFLGYSEARLGRMKPTEYTHPEDLKKEQPLLKNLQQHQAGQYQVERRFLRQDARTVWGLVSVAIVRDSDGNISHYMTQVVDITERHKAEETLRLSQERLTLAANTGKVGMWDCDCVSGFIVWNEVMHDIYKTDSVKFAPTLEAQAKFIHPEDGAKAAEEFQKCLREGGLIEQEYRIVLHDGEIRHLKANAVVFRDDTGRPLRAVGTSLDITTEKEEAEEMIRAKEDALAADKAKSEFLAVMSHEIRTPLNGVLGFVSMLKNTPLDSEQMSFVETMESSGQGLLALVNDILDLSKIESREIHVENSTFELRPFIRKVHQQLQAQAHVKELEYDFFVEYSVPKSIHTDQIRLGQILINILSNAIKFTDHGKVDLHISAKPVGIYQKNWQWTFTVRDTGPGIPAEAIPSLFKLFYQVDSSATRRHGGTGLGLAISQRIARMLDGDITVESELGKGTEFTVTITVPRGQATNALGHLAPSPRPIVQSSPKTQGKRVLVVEDNPINRKLCALQLKRLGCEAAFAETGVEAVEKVRAGQFDAVLMDMQLPDLDGCDATREIRREEPLGERLSIIALTANAMPEDRKRCLDAGMDDFLSKPLQYETLAATLSKWV